MILNSDASILDLTIREAVFNDFEQIQQMALVIYNLAPNKAEFNWPTDLFLAELKMVKTYIIESDGVIHSFICARELPDFYDISVLGTKMESRNKQYQTRLLKYLQQVAAKQRKHILLEVHEKNVSAFKLYIKMGFNLLHQRSKYYFDGGSALVMEWRAE